MSLYGNPKKNSALPMLFVLLYRPFLKFSKLKYFYTFISHGWHSAKHFRLQTRRHNFVQRDEWDVEKSLRLLSQKNYGCEKLHRQRKTLICNAVAGKALISSVIAGGVTLNPFVLASLTAFGIIVNIVGSPKKIKKEDSQLRADRIQKDSWRDTVLPQRRTFQRKRVPW